MNELELSQQPGVVTLVGAGPGDPDLLTVGAARALSRADVVLYDNLVCPEILDLAPQAEKINVGKLPFGEFTSQRAINALLVREGSLGRNVVRLKGGDPLLFGRGTEELEALHNAGIPFRVIPGVSSLNGVLGGAGLSLTARGRNHGFAVFSGAGQTGNDEIRRWADTPGPVVVFMGVHRAADIAREFIAAGRSPHEPVTVIARGGSVRELVAQTTIQELPALLADPADWTPAIIAIGMVRERAFGARPLDGKIAVVDGQPLDSPFADLLRALGARVAKPAASAAPHVLSREAPAPVEKEKT